MRNFLAIAAVAAVISGCAAPMPHGQRGHGGPGMDMQAMESMHERMHERMAAARSPGEREALMQEHRKKMGEPKGMGGMGGMCGGKGDKEADAHQH